MGGPGPGWARLRGEGLKVGSYMYFDSIAASISDKQSVGPSTLSIFTRWCFTMTKMIQVRSNFY